MSIYHLTSPARGRRTICPTLDILRAGVRIVDRVVGKNALLFAIVDDHIHVVLEGERARVGYHGSALRRAFGALVPDRPLLTAFIRPVDDRGHLQYLAETYVATRPRHHGLEAHPALYEGGCFVDLVGARALDHFTAGPLTRELPRFRMRSVYGKAGLEAAPLEPFDPSLLGLLGAGRLAEAAKAALATDGRGRSEAALAARRAAATLARQADLRLRDVALAFGAGVRALQRDAHAPRVDRHVAAVLRRLALTERCSAAPLVVAEPAVAYRAEE